MKKFITILGMIAFLASCGSRASEDIPFNSEMKTIDTPIDSSVNEVSHTTSLEWVPGNDVETGSLSFDF